MSESLARVIALAIEEACAVRDERIRQIVREELAAFRPETSAAWQSPPKAAKATDSKTKRVLQLIRDGKVEYRLRNLDANAKGKKYEVNLDSLRAALRGAEAQPEPTQPIDAATWARQRLARKGTA